MNIKLSQMRVIIWSFLITLLSACSTTPALTTNQAADQFIVAINANDVEALLQLSDFPFYIDNQLWSSTRDGQGFVLGEKTTKTFKDDKALSVYLRTLSDKLKTESVNGEYIPLTDYPRFTSELGSSNIKWQSQDAFLFLRGMGDVEHIVILGVNRNTKKISQLYFN